MAQTCLRQAYPKSSILREYSSDRLREWPAAKPQETRPPPGLVRQDRNRRTFSRQLASWFPERKELLELAIVGFKVKAGEAASPEPCLGPFKLKELTALPTLKPSSSGDCWKMIPVRPPSCTARPPCMCGLPYSISIVALQTVRRQEALYHKRCILIRHPASCMPDRRQPIPVFVPNEPASQGRQAFQYRKEALC